MASQHAWVKARQNKKNAANLIYWEHDNLNKQTRKRVEH